MSGREQEGRLCWTWAGERLPLPLPLFFSLSLFLSLSLSLSLSFSSAVYVAAAGRRCLILGHRFDCDVPTALSGDRPSSIHHHFSCPSRFCLLCVTARGAVTALPTAGC